MLALIVGVLALLFGVGSYVYAKLPYHQGELEKDSKYREEIAARLRDASLGQSYRESLARALGWLDRTFGEPGSFSALGVCVWVAVAYAYATFFIGWGLGGPGDIAGFDFMPKAPPQPEWNWFVLLAVVLPGRGLLALLAVALPVAVFYASRGAARWVTRKERGFKAWLRRRLRRRIGRRGFEWQYRGPAAVFGGLLLYRAISGGDFGLQFAVLILAIELVLLGALAGYFVARQVRGQVRPVLVAVAMGTLAVAVAVAVAGAGALAIAGAIAGALVGALVGPVAAAAAAAVALAGALTGALVGAITLFMAGAEPGALTGALAIALDVALAVALGTLLGCLKPNDAQRGLIWAGGLGAMVGLGIFSLTFANLPAENIAVLFLLLFFLILPFANGFFDWLSWWATRVLGRRLLGLLDQGQGGGQRALAIMEHGLIDLLATVALLLLMAYALAFGFEGYNELGLFQRGKPVLPDLPARIDAAAADPWGVGFWLAAMLFTTLLPTFLHGVMLLGSLAGFLFIPDSRRKKLAEDLDGYDSAGDRQASIRREIARWLTQGQMLTYGMALLLLSWLLLRFGMLWFLPGGGLAGWVRNAAHAGLDSAAWLGRVVLGS